MHGTIIAAFAWLDGAPKADIELILNTAVSFKEILNRPIKKVPTLQGKTIVNLFFETAAQNDSSHGGGAPVSCAGAITRSPSIALYFSSNGRRLARTI